MGSVVHIFGVHFLAYPTDKVRCLEREAQASVIAAYMQEKVMYPTEQVIVLGDFNDYAPNMPDAANSKPISRFLFSSFFFSILLIYALFIPTLHSHSAFKTTANQ